MAKIKERMEIFYDKILCEYVHKRVDLPFPGAFKPPNLSQITWRCPNSPVFITYTQIHFLA
jgi:hypothetical protein